MGGWRCLNHESDGAIIIDAVLWTLGMLTGLAHQFPGTAIGQRMINDRIQAIRRLLPLQKACHG